MTDARLAEIKSRLSRITEPPWQWEVYPKTHDIGLVGRSGWGVTVMGFARWGMSGGTPTFRDEDGNDKKAKEFIADGSGRDMCDWFRVTHPDAEFIESAPGDVADLIKLVDKLQDRIKDLVVELGSLTSKGDLDDNAYFS